MPKRGSSARRSRSRPTRNSGKRSEYAKAARQTDGSRFVIMAQDKHTWGQNADVLKFIIQANVDRSNTVYLSPMVAFLKSQMGVQVLSMYDEFRIKSFRCKIMLQMGSVTGQFTLNSAFDRSGRLSAFAFTPTNGGNLVQTFTEREADIMTYSSLQSKQIVQYQSGTMNRTLTPQGTLESQFMSTALVDVLNEGNAEGEWFLEQLGHGFRPAPFNQGFCPTLLLNLQTQPQTGAAREIAFTVDWQFDIAVRGLRAYE